jgi:hypothetical protein
MNHGSLSYSTTRANDVLRAEDRRRALRIADAAMRLHAVGLALLGIDSTPFGLDGRARIM